MEWPLLPLLLRDLRTARGVSFAIARLLPPNADRLRWPRRHSAVTRLRFYWFRERESAPFFDEARASAQLPLCRGFFETAESPASQ